MNYFMNHDWHAWHDMHNDHEQLKCCLHKRLCFTYENFLFKSCLKKEFSLHRVYALNDLDPFQMTLKDPLNDLSSEEPFSVEVTFFNKQNQYFKWPWPCKNDWVNFEINCLTVVNIHDIWSIPVQKLLKNVHVLNGLDLLKMTLSHLHYLNFWGM
jgi:hypothetical protein